MESHEHQKYLCLSGGITSGFECAKYYPGPFNPRGTSVSGLEAQARTGKENLCQFDPDAGRRVRRETLTLARIGRC